MRVMKRWVTAALAALASTTALADYTDEAPVFACDGAASRVAIWFEGRDNPQDFATAVEVTAATASAHARIRLARAHNTADGNEVVERVGP